MEATVNINTLAAQLDELSTHHTSQRPKPANGSRTIALSFNRAEHHRSGKLQWQCKAPRRNTRGEVVGDVMYIMHNNFEEAVQPGRYYMCREEMVLFEPKPKERAPRIILVTDPHPYFGTEITELRQMLLEEQGRQENARGFTEKQFRWFRCGCNATTRMGTAEHRRFEQGNEIVLECENCGTTVKLVNGQEPEFCWNEEDAAEFCGDFSSRLAELRQKIGATAPAAQQQS